MDIKEIRALDEKLITAKVTELQKELFTLKMQSATSGVEKPHKKKFIKKDIARLLTVKNTKK